MTENNYDCYAIKNMVQAAMSYYLLMNSSKSSK